MSPGRCPADYVAVGSSGHRYKRLGAVSWDQARAMCEQGSAATYLLIPDGATELADLAMVRQQAGRAVRMRAVSARSSRNRTCSLASTWNRSRDVIAFTGRRGCYRNRRRATTPV